MKVDNGLFAVHYVRLNCDAVRALRACGMSHDLMDETEAELTAQHLLRQPEVQEKIYNARATFVMDAMETLHRLATIARGDALEDCLTEDGEIDIVAAREKKKLWLVQEYSTQDTKEGQTRKVKVYSALDAIKTIAKHHGLLDSIFGSGKVPKDLREIQKRLAEKAAAVQFQGGVVES